MQWAEATHSGQKKTVFFFFHCLWSWKTLPSLAMHWHWCSGDQNLHNRGMEWHSQGKRKKQLELIEMQKGFFSSTGFGCPLNWCQCMTITKETQRELNISVSAPYIPKCFQLNIWNLSKTSHLYRRNCCVSAKAYKYITEKRCIVIQCLKEHKSFWAACFSVLWQETSSGP